MDDFNISIGVIGLGFVGTAVAVSYRSSGVNLVCMDTDPSKGHTATYNDIKQCDAIFICVPSPQNDDGSCNSKPLRSVLNNLVDYKNLIISKVTAPPDVYEELQNQFPNLVHSPEFLTAARAIEDYLNGKFSIIGGSVTAYKKEAERIIKLGQSNIEHVMFCSIGEAALAKYTINCFLATKVIFMNEISKLAETGGQSWDVVRKMIMLDHHRLGNSHTQVPGPDGLYGFGGACFPKDTAALLKYSENLGCQLNVLNSAVKKNTLLRLTDQPK